MNTVICEEPFTLGRAASNWCREKIERYQARSIFVPAGQTPITLYKLWEAEKPAYLKGLRLLQIDEVISGEQKGLFERFFHEHLPSFTNQLVPIRDAEEGADLAILGLGVNGHVAFHEPGIPDKFYSGCVLLTPETRQYLSLEPDARGLSYGVDAFRRAKAVLMIVSGTGKRDILSRLARRDPSLPATSLLNHRDFTLLADRAAFKDTGFESAIEFHEQN